MQIMFHKHDHFSSVCRQTAALVSVDLASTSLQKESCKQTNVW